MRPQPEQGSKRGVWQEDRDEEEELMQLREGLRIDDPEEREEPREQGEGGQSAENGALEKDAGPGVEQGA
eukprot:677625-Rhodomonas_salina.1